MVRDATSGEALPLATVLVVGSQNGASTSPDGSFELRLLPGTHQLRVSLVGYRTEIVSVTLTASPLSVAVLLTRTDVLLQDVTVYAAPVTDEANEVSAQSLEGRLIGEISSAVPDVFRSIQMLPGVAVDNEFNAKFNVRGGNYDENLVLVNGTTVYEPFHIKEADNASIGIFNVDLMRKVDFITGGFSARYGDKMSSVLNIEYREGNRDHYAGSATLSLTDLNAMIEGPLGDQASIILGARKSYLEYVLSLLEVEKTAKPSFYDIQGVITWHPDQSRALQAKFIHAGDHFTQSPEPASRSSSGTLTLGTLQVPFGQSSMSDEHENSRYFSNLFALQSTSVLSGSAVWKAEVSLYDQSDEEFYEENSDYMLLTQASPDLHYLSHSHDIRDVSLNIRTWEARTSLDLQLNPWYDLQTGVVYQHINYDQHGTDRTTTEVDENVNNYPDTTTRRYQLLDIRGGDGQILAHSFKLAGYAENVVQLTDRFLINAGGRADYFAINREWTLSPRLSAAMSLSGETTARAAWGFYYQSPTYRQLSSPAASDTNTQSQKATHYILGLEHVMPAAEGMLTLKLEGYYKNYTTLVSSVIASDGTIVYSRRNDAKGYARGIDLYAAWKKGAFSGWVSYGLLSTQEDAVGDSLPAYPRYTDQRHTIAAVADFSPWEQWHMNLRFVYGSGFPFTPSTARYNTTAGRYEWVRGSLNADHLPAYRRLDVRVEKELALWGLRAVVFLDVSNALNFSNVFGYRYRFASNGTPRVEEVELWPIVPSLGLTARF